MPVNWERRHEAFKAIHDKIAEICDKPNLVGFLPARGGLKAHSGFYEGSSYDYWSYYFYYAYNIGNWIEFEFEGPILGIVLRKASNLGILKVVVDDVDIEKDIDAYSPTTISNSAIFITDELSSGRHTVRFETKDKNPLSTGYMAWIHGILVSKLKNWTDMVLSRAAMIHMDRSYGRSSRTFTLDPDAEDSIGWLNHGNRGFSRFSLNIKNGDEPFEVYVDTYNAVSDNYGVFKTYSLSANERKSDDFFCSAVMMRVRAKNVGTASGTCIVEYAEQV